MAYQGGLSGLRPVSMISQLSTAFPAENRVKTISGHDGSFTGGRIGTAVGKADSDHVLFRHDRLDRHSDVGKLLVQAREGPLHSLATATDARRFGVKLVLVREELVGRVQVLLVDHMLHDSAHGGLVLGGSH